jgi:plasmid replication initiation protein
MLYNRSIWISGYGNPKEGEKIRWLSRQKYSERKGEVTFNFGREVITHLSGMVDFFTSYKILAVSGFKSVHSIRIYELCAQFKKTGYRVITVTDFRTILGLENEYAKWNDLSKNVLLKALKEINTKSDISVQFQLIKRGRNIHAIKFLIDHNDQYQLPLDC